MWNPHGKGLLFENYPFPVVTIVNNASVGFLINMVLLLYHYCYIK